MDDRTTNPDDAHGRAWLILLGCWLAAAGASLGSLFFSEIMELAPCSLCWYQRAFMFPLAIVLFVGVLAADRGCTRYALPLAVGGWLTALYHVLLQVGVLPEAAAPCRQGVSCTEVDFALLGFASIPVLALVAFSGITAGLLLVRRNSRCPDRNP
jgi:disulfide bond formation protein DsbB